MNSAHGETGFYGKLPCRGDFLQRRVPQDFLERWDAWLQACMHTSKQQLQASWLDRYLTGPVWRFVLAEGVCGETAYAGILVPSVDRVGRYFPLTVLAQLNDGCALDVGCQSAPWFEAAETLVLDALAAEQMDIDRFDEQVAQLAALLSAAPAGDVAVLTRAMDDGTLVEASDCRRIPLGSAQSLQRAVNVFAHRELRRTHNPLAVWWTEGSDAVEPTWLCTRGLPAAATFTPMLSGDWTGTTGLGAAIVSTEATDAASQPQ